MGNLSLKRFFPASLALILVLFIPLAYASVFAYYPASVGIQGVSPTLAFASLPHAYTCTALTRTDRGAVTYTDFEAYPLPGWANRGGTGFQLVAGHKGYAIQYSDNNGGIGGASQYYYNSNLGGYSSLWVAVKVYGPPSDQTIYSGLALINSDFNRLYEVAIYAGNINIASYNVEANNTWYVLRRVAISNYASGNWYTIVLNYAVTATAVNFYVWVYDPSGNQVAYASASSTSPNRFAPAYIGLQVDRTGTATVNYGRFDDFIISTRDPRTVTFSNLQGGLVFNIYDNLGALTYSFTATSSTFSLTVVRDVVLGTGTDGSIRILYPGGSPACLDVLIPATDAFLGGNSYTLTTRTLTWSTSTYATSASVSAYISPSGNQRTSFHAIALSASQSFYVQLRLDVPASTIHPSLNAQVYIQGGTQPITIVGGVANPATTDWVYLPAGSTTYIAVSGAHASAGSESTLVFNVVACTHGRLDIDPAPGACVFYPLTITLRGG